MWFLLVLLSTFSSTFSGANKKSCGGVYTAARGVLSTPNFPDPFKVPINCEWVIDAQLSSAANTSIVVYLTQLFVYEGLTFTEYQIYGDDYKINPKIIHTVNETNISRTRWIKTYQSFLVIQLKLSSADSVHLRVLDKFLDVFGFNITYEITTGSVRSNSCTMMDCGFTGNCYDYYTKFSCSCLQGYSGPTCSNGSNSFCDPGGVRTCKNGGRCIHVGVAAVRCACTSNFTGPTCDTPVISETTRDCSRCRICPSDDRFEAQCKCVNKDSVNISHISKEEPDTEHNTLLNFEPKPNTNTIINDPDYPQSCQSTSAQPEVEQIVNPISNSEANVVLLSIAVGHVEGKTAILEIPDDMCPIISFEKVHESPWID
ncbi:uncharacterized protein LOC130453164 [Diorhabda sublineata]|uniref:uncharacterized protein LOC130453164 n=1 Tax=Diorhabda sublineata TaxID=1163346 RepID=UPI0024E05860|nr:uncharacterized protein LOC130453164 [Diorhabda sublineata]